MQLTKLIDANIHSLETAEALLQAINEAQYQAVVEPFSASLGKHLRHITDHYQRLFAGLPQGQVEYDQRERLEIEESQRSAMILRLRSIIHQLRLLAADAAADRELCVCLAVDETGLPPSVPSSLSRELVFLQSHSVHHYAIIAAILRLQNIDIGRDFGIAPSTLQYEKRRCAP